jgi:transcriptional regulator with XRE-family HTH domain
MLKELIKTQGLLQRDIARRLLVSDATVSKWVSGKHPVPLSKIRKLAEELNVSVDALIPPDETGSRATVEATS